MNNDERIEYLNNDILKISRKIKNIEIFNDVVGITSGFSLIVGINTVSLLHIPQNYKYLQMPVLLLSIAIGMVPSINLPTYKTMKKMILYQEKIRNNINELHEIALEENKKMMKKI